MHALPPAHLMYLDSAGHGPDILAYGAVATLDCGVHDSPFEQLKGFRKGGGHVFGLFSYDLKNAIEELESANESWIEWPEMSFFKPAIVLRREKGSEWELVEENDPHLYAAALQFAQDMDLPPSATTDSSVGEMKVISQSEYLKQVESLQHHIQIGDIYEVNFCQEFQYQETKIDPLKVYSQLRKKTSAPYSAFFRSGDRYLLSASPELFMKKEGTTVRSSPIKGTRPRGEDTFEDAQIRTELRHDMKERAENVMITDLVRNDLSKTAEKNSVMVEELCRIHTFETVHQMISTVTSTVDPKVDPVDIIESCFPMGSMTGAPKIRAMELIESHEQFKRGAYSGAIGYFNAEDEFTFNVVIRSIQYDAQTARASVAAGGAITAASEPQSEYVESLLKARAMRSILEV